MNPITIALLISEEAFNQARQAIEDAQVITSAARLDLGHIPLPSADEKLNRALAALVIAVGAIEHVAKLTIENLKEAS